MDRGVGGRACRAGVFRGAMACRISSQRIYRALGVENICHRRTGAVNVLVRRRPALDYVLEHPGMGWLPSTPARGAIPSYLSLRDGSGKGPLARVDSVQRMPSRRDSPTALVRGEASILE